MRAEHLDTTTPTGKLLFRTTGAFAEFERSMIRQRVNAGLAPIKAKIARGEKFTSKAGIVRCNLARPGAAPQDIEQAKIRLSAGNGIVRVAKELGLGVGTVHKLKRQMTLGG